MTLALFTSTEFKNYVGITATTWDSPISDLVTRVSAMVESHLDRPLEDTGADVTEYYDGTGTNMLRVRRVPIYSVTSVHVDSLRSFDSNSEILAADRVTDAEAGIITLLAGTSDLFGVEAFSRGRQNVRVIYRGGYKSSSPVGNAIPSDLTLGALIWAASIWNKRKDHGLVTASMGTISDTFTQLPMPPEARRILAGFKAPLLRSGFGT